MRSLVRVCALALLLATVTRAEDPSPPALLTKDDLKALKIKDLRALLASRGRSCEGCSEKADYVDLALEVQHLPTLAATPTPTPAPMDNEEIERIVRQMKERQSGGGARIARVKAKMAARGMSTAGLDGMDLTSFADFSPDE